MWLDMIILSFIVAFFRGGRLKETPRFNRLSLLLIAIFLQVVTIWMHSGIGNVVFSLSYLFVIAFFYANREMEDIRVLMIGWFMNAIAIWVNFGKMPVDLEQAKKTPFSVDGIINGTDFKHIIITSHTHFPFLADIFYLPYPIPRVISVGDIFIAFGMFLLIQRVMNKPISLLMLREGNANAFKN